MKNIKFYVGPMSKNVVDAILEFVEETNNKIGFIPSRRQVEYNGGYVNNWITKEFSEYVNGRVPIQRDHGGPGQGYKPDDGVESFIVDAHYLDIIHIDPWKMYSNYDNGLKYTINFIKRIYNINSDVLFEVGTEETIRRFSVSEFNDLLIDLSRELPLEMFSNIQYAVVQSGVGLDLGKQINTGTFDSDRLSDMVQICREFNVLSKEHNGDYLTDDEIQKRFNIGLDSINIAPEFGQLETLCYLEEMDGDIEDYYKICYDSKRWEKWVRDDFIPENNKKELIKICGHYVLSNDEFIKIKPDIDLKIKQTIKNRLGDLYNDIRE